jgi:FAD/FMN-containing dehydrogenase/Fe-S oxidoreductase
MSTTQAQGLHHELRRALSGEVRFDDGHRALYATDSSNYRQVPVGVVFPRDEADVEAAVAVCRRLGVPILTRGAGTSLAGQACNVAVVLDTTRHFNRVLELDEGARRAIVQPGLVLDRLQEAAAAAGLMFGPDPATHACCTLGGMIGNNSCGVHSLSAGKTVDNVEELVVLTSDGERLRVGPTSPDDLNDICSGNGRRAEIYRRLAALRDRHLEQIRTGFPRLPRRVSGYNLDELLPESGFNLARALVGSEGTCAIVLAATLRLVPRPPERVLLVRGYANLVNAAEEVPAILEHRPDGLEGFDAGLLEGARRKLQGTSAARRGAWNLLPEGQAWLLVEFGGQEREAATSRAQRLLDALGKGASPPAARLYESDTDQKSIWGLRESAVGATSRIPGVGDCWPGWEDSAVHPERLATYLTGLGDLFARHGVEGSIYGHFGDGCIHARLNFGLTQREGVAIFRRFMEDASDLVVAHGGSISGEHGDGQARGELLSRMFGPELMEAFREFKAIWDPDGLLNPGKLVDPRPLDADLRQSGAVHRAGSLSPAGVVSPARDPASGRSASAARLDTHFHYTEDDGSFARAVLRCVGVGKCRRDEGGLMCPSYMATRDEQHSTRGRARLLEEMLRGEIIRDGWSDERVKKALDLCLACKGCKSDCPAGVDMATYKAEFLSHYYEKRHRPLGVRAFGLVAVTARLGSVAPRLFNRVLNAGPTGRLLRRLLGVAPERCLPELAEQTFRHWFRRRSASASIPASPSTADRRLILWPDTFTNYYQPHIARAATELLEQAGFRVEIPARALCCGRPLFDAGLLETAVRWQRRICATLAGPLADGLPVVGLEPGCVSVFKDEMVKLLPANETARRLSRQTYLLEEFLDRHDIPLAARFPERKVLVQGHCHQQALIGMEPTRCLLERAGIEAEILADGCCGMAGSFGFRREHAQVAQAVGERILLPRLRELDGETLVVADGFSCREQIRQESGREPVHLVEILATPGEER